MNKKYIFLFCLVLLGNTFTSRAQLVCPPNIDFELGTTAIWNYFRGTVSTGPIFSLTACPATPGWHTLTSGAGLDYYGGFPIVDPGGGSYALKIGHDTNNNCAERASYLIHVPTGVVNYSLVYRYAVVFEDPGTTHTGPEKPTFLVNAYDSATATPIPCSQYTYVAGSGLPGFANSTVTSRIGNGFDVVYKDWATASINLSGWGGHTIEIDFTAGDCTLGGHFGYGYLDMSCGLFEISGLSCGDTSTTVSLTAPPGFSTYSWYDSATFTTNYGSTQIVSIHVPSVATTYAVVMEPYVGFGCPDTLYTHLQPTNLVLNPSHDTLICSGAGTTLTSGATDIALPLSYSWYPSTGLSCTTCANPLANPTTTTTYTVTVTDAAGCTQSAGITVAIGHVAAIVTPTRPSCYGVSDGSATVTTTSGLPPFTYVWSTVPVQTSATATNLSGTTVATGGTVYTVFITDRTGCTDLESVTIYQPDSNIMAIASAINPDSCLRPRGSITISGLAPSNVFTVGYLFNGVPQTQTITSSSSGTGVLTTLYAGTYSNIRIITTGCQYNVIGPVTLVDPRRPIGPYISSNSPVCEGTPLLLTASTPTPRVLYSWHGPLGFTSVSQNPSISPAILPDSGVYVLSIDTANCISTDSIYVSTKPYAHPFAGSNSAVCSGDSLKLTSYSTNGSTSYRWYGPNVFSSNQQNPVISMADTNATGTYTVYVTLNGCLNSTTTDVTINQTPPMPQTIDTSYCQNATAVPLVAFGSNLLWYTTATGGTGSTTPPIPSTLDTGKTTWYVSQTSTAGCTSVERAPVSATIYYLAAPQIQITDSVICMGTGITFTAQNTGDDMTGITWSFNAGDSIKNVNPVVHSYEDSGSYTVYINAFYKYCPVETASRNIIIFPHPNLDLGPDTTICAGGLPILLSNKHITSGLATWLWSNGSTSPTLTVTAPGTYYGKVTLNGCTATDTVIVSNDCYISFPNIFSPNGDGLNDYFFPRQILTKGLTSFSMNIYNRWGQLVFSTTSINGEGWDGRFNNEPQPEGVYIYSIDATFKDGQIEHHQGNVTLIR